MRVSVASPTSRGRQGRAVGAAVVGSALVVGAAGCTDNKAMGGSANPPVKLTITPGDGTGAARPDLPIVVKAVGGTIQNVTVTTKGTPVNGEVSPDGTEWHSHWTLAPTTAYQVTATGLGNDGKTQSTTSSFTTLRARQSIRTTLEAPFANEKVGVGMPIILSFDRAVTDRAGVERALEVKATHPVVGAWHWFDPQTLVFRTKTYWPRNTRVTFTAHMAGVRAARSVYGLRDITSTFTVGDQHISTASEDNHHMIVKLNGRRIRNIPISMGRGGIEKYTTTNGVHLTMEKGNPVIMDSSTVGCGPGCPDYYRETVYHAVRISNSGEYVHSAPWSVGAQGNSNVSHGCINVAPSNAVWFYNWTRRGDIVKVTGTSRELEPDNGWGYWQMPWTQWVAGSALHQALTVTADGSAPVPTATPTPAPAPAPDGAPTAVAASPSPART